jgi:hypothetical protein
MRENPPADLEDTPSTGQYTASTAGITNIAVLSVLRTDVVHAVLRNEQLKPG